MITEKGTGIKPEKAIERELKKIVEQIEKDFIDETKFVNKEIILNTPVFRPDPKLLTTPGSWELKNKNPGKAKRGWRSSLSKSKDVIKLVMLNKVKYIRVLEFGGFGNFKRFRIWGDYAGRGTRRTRPSDVAEMNSNVSKQAPRGMARQAILRSINRILRMYGKNAKLTNKEITKKNDNG